MEAQVWTLIGLIATGLMGMFFFMSTRFDAINDRFGKIDEKLAQLGAESTLTRGDLARIEERLAGFEGRFDDHIRWHAS